MKTPWVALFASTLACLGACKGCGLKPGERYAEQPPPPPSAPASGGQMKESEILAFVNPQKLPVYRGPTGSLEGTITITGDPSPDVPGLDFHKCPAGKDTYEKLFRVGAPLPSGARPLADALVAVTGYAGFIPERNPARKVTFEHCALDARTIDVTVGQKIEVTGKDDLLFAPSLTQAPMPALMLASKSTEPVSLYPPRPGYFTLVDRMELSYVRADVYTLLQPLHTVTLLDGHYRIDGIPVGKVLLSTRLARIRKEASKQVEVSADAIKTVDMSVEFNAATDTPAPPTRPPGPRIP